MGGGKTLTIKHLTLLKHFKTFLLLTFLCAFSFISHAQTTFTQGNFTYTVTTYATGYVSVKAANTSISGAITIPSSVTNNGTTYRVWLIDIEAFKNCTGLTNITIPSSITAIHSYAFVGCTSLTSITIPYSVNFINPSIFANCNNLTSITVATNNTTFKSVNNAILTKSTNKLVAGCKNTTIPSYVDSIGNGAFEGCTGLTRITIPSSVKSIGSRAFHSCTGLTSITIPNSVTSIGGYAFHSCTGLTSIIIGNSVTTIENYTFYGCTGLTSITIPNSVTSIGSAAFYRCTGLTSITIPNSVTSIGYDAFSNCSSLTSVTIGNSVISINYNAFANCSGLTSITLTSNTPPTLTTYSFNNISSSATFYVPNESYLTANNWSTILKNYNVSIPNTNVLHTNRWNFVAGLGNDASLYNNNTPASFASTFTAGNTSDPTSQNYPHCDIAIAGYDYQNNAWNNTFLYANETMTAGNGYFVWAFNENYYGTTVTSDNTLTSVNMSNYYKTSDVQVSQTNSGTANTSGTGTNAVSAKWFAFGNPFNKNLSTATIFAANGLSNVQSDVLYTYNAYTGTWSNTATTVLPGQGFMVAAIDGQNTVSGTLNYPTNTGNSAPMQPENYGIRFSVNANGMEADMFAKQENNAQDGFDQKDAYALFGNNEDLVEPYFVVDGRQIIHNRYNSDNYSCAVNFHAQKSGVAELSVSDIPEGTTVSIVDLAMNTETILNDEAYQIEVEAGENANRYLIKINKAGASVSLPQSIENEANIFIWNNNKEIFIKGEQLQRVEVYNTLGQMVYQKQISGQEYNFTISTKGAYIIKSLSKNGTKTQKIVIK